MYLINIYPIHICARKTKYLKPKLNPNKAAFVPKPNMTLTVALTENKIYILSFKKPKATHLCDRFSRNVNMNANIYSGLAK